MTQPVIEYYPLDADAVTKLWAHVFSAKSPRARVKVSAIELFAALAMIDKMVPAEMSSLELRLPQHWQPKSGR